MTQINNNKTITNDQSFLFNQFATLYASNLSYLLFGIFFVLYFLFNLDVEGIIIIDVFLIISVIYLCINKQVYLFILYTKNTIVSSIFNHLVLIQQLCLNVFLFVLQMKVEFYFWKILTKNWLDLLFFEFSRGKDILKPIFVNELNLSLQEIIRETIVLRKTKITLLELFLVSLLQIEYLCIEFTTNIDN